MLGSGSSGSVRGCSAMNIPTANLDPFRKSATFKEISIAPPKFLPEGSSIGFQLLSESVE